MIHSHRSIVSGSRLAAAALVMVCVVTGGCKDKSVPGSAGTGNEILIGDYESTTGGTATFGTETANGINLAVDQTNASGGVNGKKVRIDERNDQSLPDEAQNVVTDLVTKDKVVAVLGEVASTRSMRGGSVCQQYGIPMITPSSTNPKVTAIGDDIFRVCFTDDFQAAVAARFAIDQGFKRAAIFKDIKNDYSVAFADVFSRSFQKFGGKIVGEQSYQEGDADFHAQLNSLKPLDPDVLLVPGYYTEVGSIARQARDVGLNIPLLGGDGWDSPKLTDSAGTALDGSFFTDHYFSTDLKDAATQQFVEAFKAKYSKPPDALAALGYDAAGLLIQAMKSAKTLDSAGIRDAIAAVKDYPGVTGKITIDANRNARKSALVFQIKGTGFKVFKTYTPEQVGL